MDEFKPLVSSRPYKPAPRLPMSDGRPWIGVEGFGVKIFVEPTPHGHFVTGYRVEINGESEVFPRGTVGYQMASLLGNAFRPDGLRLRSDPAER